MAETGPVDIQQAVYKYPLGYGDFSDVILPLGAEILHVAFQGEDLFLWARINPEEIGAAKKYFRLAGTGHSGATGRYIGTASKPAALFSHHVVIHVFELT